ncbi:MAG: hypothetical protein GY807_20345 [Gammaproteobacteria bacterium]|nr:hypothetical protein [Gammaproteobacteria bacterium]
MNTRLATLVLMIVVLALFRLFPHPPNITPIAAMALFGGAYFTNRLAAFLLPLAALFLSDILLGFHGSMSFVYAAFVITVMIGWWLREHPTVGYVFSAALVSSVLFFVITNFGAWLTLELYPKTAEGLWSAYLAGIPFFRNTIVGNLGYTLLVFGGFWTIERSVPSVRLRTC